MSAKSHYLHFLESLQKALRKVQEQKPCLIFVHGNGDYFAFKALNAIKTIWQEKMNASTYKWSADILKKESFLEIAEQRSLFEKVSLNFISNLKRQTDLATWLSTCEGRLENILVITIHSDKIIAQLEKHMNQDHCLSISCKKPMRWEIPDIAKHLLKKRKLHLNSEALQKLLLSVGEDLYSLENEIERFSLAFHEQSSVSASDLAPYLNTLTEEQSFKLIRLLLDQKYNRAHLFIQQLLLQGESPIGLVSLIAWHCRNALHILESQRVSSSQKTSPLKLSYTLRKDYQNYARGLKKEHVVEALKSCQTVDSYLKSRPASADNLLAIPIYKLAQTSA